MGAGGSRDEGRGRETNEEAAEVDSRSYRGQSRVMAVDEGKVIQFLPDRSKEPSWFPAASDAVNESKESRTILNFFLFCFVFFPRRRFRGL